VPLCTDLLYAAAQRAQRRHGRAKSAGSLAARANDAVERCEINGTTDDYAKQRISIRMTDALKSACE
jgi:hypothetical protein